MLTSDVDRVVWTATESGNFKLTSAWELTRTRNISVYFNKFCWNKFLPIKISIFLWRLLHKTLPTDMAVRGKGIHIVSKCVCCMHNSQTESVTHLFASSEVVVQVWDKSLS